MLAASLAMGWQRTTVAAAGLQVDIALTPAGAAVCFRPGEAGPAAVPLRPVALVFDYLAMLARGPPEHCWQELKAAAAAQFRCASPLHGMHSASSPRWTRAGPRDRGDVFGWVRAGCLWWVVGPDLMEQIWFLSI